MTEKTATAGKTEAAATGGNAAGNTALSSGKTQAHQNREAAAAEPQMVLGQRTAFPDHYAPEMLVPIPRADNRRTLGIADGSIPFLGADIWTAYELSWLNARGKPQLAIVHLIVPCETPYLVESKSLKLYLNSFSSEAVESAEHIRQTIARDVGQVVWGAERDVGVRLTEPDAFAQQQITGFEGQCMDRLDVECSVYSAPAAELLRCVPGEESPVQEVLYSRLLKSNCLVTGQPDWGSVQVAYTGRQIDQERLLQYIVSYRSHNAFHEHCAERMYMDIMRQCQPLKLRVYTRYTRRGGIDINPLRSSHPQPLPPLHRHARQ